VTRSGYQKSTIDSTGGAPDLEPGVALLTMITGYVKSQLVRAAAELRVADHLAAGPRSSAELAEAMAAEPGALLRFLRACAAIGLVTEVSRGEFANTAMGDLLRDEGSRFRDFALAFAGTGMYRPCEAMAEVARTGRPATEMVLGAPIWDYYRAQPAEARHYDEMMAFLTTNCADGLVADWDFTAARRIVDVGGGRGVLLRRVLQAAPQATGVLYDQPAVVAGAGVVPGERIEPVAGSFLAEVPAGADTYLLKSVLCDWAEEEAAQIVSNVYTAAPPGARLLVIDWILADELYRPETVAGVDAGLPITDFGLLVAMGGRIRTASQFRELISRAGFTVERIGIFTAGPSRWGLIVARRP
jgi:hypothetical protein